MTTTTALLILVLVVLALLVGSALFWLAHARPALAGPLKVALAGLMLMTACITAVVGAVR
ncbi:hypothetical protein [Streptomyces sp. BPTC-684]|uniref:hypothetical protein n=1 Tax=Streptomyces sp. BPTC-684 TaxID=3043734 RepID=UPI0024B068B3|nr:hypothetical protein [Streptomyces sp. BPTC-684]WHM41105.1 hypothetical protein QIY60_32445 [Streptomyces sp. BPTC-684]